MPDENNSQRITRANLFKSLNKQGFPNSQEIDEMSLDSRTEITSASMYLDKMIYSRLSLIRNYFYPETMLLFGKKFLTL